MSELRKIKFSFEEISTNKIIEINSNVLQVGFINYSTKWLVLLNGFPLYPTPAVITIPVNEYFLWFPIAHNEKDTTQWNIQFIVGTGGAIPTDPKRLVVCYKQTNLS